MRPAKTPIKIIVDLKNLDSSAVHVVIKISDRTIEVLIDPP